MTTQAITIDGALTGAWTSERLAVLRGSLVKRRAIHLRANRSSVAYTMCIIGLLNSADEIFAPYSDSTQCWRERGIQDSTVLREQCRAQNPGGRYQNAICRVAVK